MPAYHVRKLHVGIPLRLPVWKLEVVLHDKLAENHLDLVGGKEAPGASVAAVSKVQTVGAHADELVERTALVRCLLGMLAHLVESQRVKLVGVREDLWVGADGDGRDFDRHAGGDRTAVGEREWAQHLALERGCT